MAAKSNLVYTVSKKNRRSETKMNFSRPPPPPSFSPRQLLFASFLLAAIFPSPPFFVLLFQNEWMTNSKTT